VSEVKKPLIQIVDDRIFDVSIAEGSFGFQDYIGYVVGIIAVPVQSIVAASSSYAAKFIELHNGATKFTG
jgi:hypothetical protein